MKRWMSAWASQPAVKPGLKTTRVIGLTLILGVNVITLGLVAWNRSGEPEAVLTLSERELDRPWNWRGRSNENSGLALKLRWRVTPPAPRKDGGKPGADASNTEAPDDGVEAWAYGGNADFLDAAKLRSLGFALNDDATRRTESGHAVLLVLENNGPAYVAALERARARLTRETVLRDANPDKPEFVHRAKRATEHLADEEIEASRLFIVDAGLDADALRVQYPDRQRYAIVGGRVRPGWGDPRHREARRGHIEHIDAGTVNVPNALRAAVPPYIGRRGNTVGAKTDDRFGAEIAFGKRFEPWLRQASRPDSGQRSTPP